jgi:hypothetical protein
MDLRRAGVGGVIGTGAGIKLVKATGEKIWLPILAGAGALESGLKGAPIGYFVGKIKDIKE